MENINFGYNDNIMLSNKLKIFFFVGLQVFVFKKKKKLLSVGMILVYFPMYKFSSFYLWENYQIVISRKVI